MIGALPPAGRPPVDWLVTPRLALAEINAETDRFAAGEELRQLIAC